MSRGQMHKHHSPKLSDGEKNLEKQLEFLKQKEHNWNQITLDQQNGILAANEDIKNGNWISLEEVMVKIRKKFKMHKFNR